MLKKFASFFALAAAVIACEPGVEKQEPTVETIAFTNSPKSVYFQKNGGEFTAQIEANCDWTLTCTETWVTPAKASGNGNDNVSVTVGTTMQGREADLVLECVNVPGRKDIIHIVQEGGKEISSVAATVVTDLVTTDGTTASLASSFVAYGVKAEDVVTAGFTITGGAEPIEVAGIIDAAASTFTGSATGLTPDTNYSVKAWARINSDEKVYGEAAAFKPEKEAPPAEPVTVVADFTDANATTRWASIVGKIADVTADEVSITDENNYVWKFSGACLDGCLWLETTAKASMDGYVILPKLEGKKVTSIDFPNDGPSPSGKARITISISTDGGSTFAPVGDDYTDKTLGKFEFTNQPEGAIYKITNVKVSSGGRSKTTKITITAI
ncbi:MAG: BACON domain-containing protein [Bacteroidales bacterium]|nr:BACON domain-containing protein [Bacteroidales bacterium]